MNVPRGYGWSVYPTGSGTYDVYDHYAKATVATLPSRSEAWAHVSAVSSARYAKEAA